MKYVVMIPDVKGCNYGNAASSNSIFNEQGAFKIRACAATKILGGYADTKSIFMAEIS